MPHKPFITIWKSLGEELVKINNKFQQYEILSSYRYIKQNKYYFKQSDEDIPKAFFSLIIIILMVDSNPNGVNFIEL